MKRLMPCILLILCLTTQWFLPVCATGQEDPDGSARSFIVFEQDTNQIILQQNIDAEADASLLARMMCALVVLESSINGTTVSITDSIKPVSNSTSTDGNYKLYASKEYSVDALLKATLLANADNCARVLADHINPRREFFVSLMNQTAARIGMTQTYFTNADGSFNNLQRTTVRDTALFYDYALKNTQFRRILTNEVTTIWDGITLFNTCSVAFSTKEEFGSSAVGGAYTGIKWNGSTLMMHATVPTLNTAASVSTTPMKLIIILTSKAKEDDVAHIHNLLTDIQTNYQKSRVVAFGEALEGYSLAGKELQLLAGNDLYCVIPKDVDSKSYVQNMSYEFNTETELLEPPILKDQVLGAAHLLLRDGSIQEVTIIAGNTIQTDSQAVNWMLALYEQYQSLFILVFILLLAVLFIMVVKVVYWVRSRKQQQV